MQCHDSVAYVILPPYDRKVSAIETILLDLFISGPIQRKYQFEIWECDSTPQFPKQCVQTEGTLA